MSENIVPGKPDAELLELKEQLSEANCRVRLFEALHRDLDRSKREQAAQIETSLLCLRVCMWRGQEILMETEAALPLQVIV